MQSRDLFAFSSFNLLDISKHPLSRAWPAHAKLVALILAVLERSIAFIAPSNLAAQFVESRFGTLNFVTRAMLSPTGRCEVAFVPTHLVLRGSVEIGHGLLVRLLECSLDRIVELDVAGIGHDGAVVYNFAGPVATAFFGLAQDLAVAEFLACREAFLHSANLGIAAGSQYGNGHGQAKRLEDVDEFHEYSP
ncbi:hypothetical protein D9M72_448080 [compost metagenome]